MKVAILGSAPSSLSLAPFGDPSWKIWACSPGTYPYMPRCDEFFELHRPEFGEIGKPATQKPWFSPEYVAWMAQQPKVWMAQPHPAIPNSDTYPLQEMSQKFGNYFFTSSIALMMAMAIDQILAERERRDATQEADAIALFGVDMAANEEYGYQRAGCQYFATLAHTLGIQLLVPPESDVLRPMPVYGISESLPWMIKLTRRREELLGKKAMFEQQVQQATANLHATMGALDDNEYHMKTWGGDRDGMGTSPGIYAQSPLISQILQQRQAAVDETPDTSGDR